MNTASDILSYAVAHDIHLFANGDELKVNAPKEALTDEFLQSAKQHKTEILNAISDCWYPKIMARVSEACVGLDMTPVQFIRVLNSKGKQQIISGELSASTLKDYAKQIDDCINDGVVKLIMEKIT